MKHADEHAKVLIPFFFKHTNIIYRKWGFPIGGWEAA